MSHLPANFAIGAPDEDQPVLRFAELLVQKTGQTPQDLRASVGTQLDNTHFLVPLKKDIANEVFRGAGFAFGKGSVSLHRPKSVLRINRQFLAPLQEALEQLGRGEAAPVPVADGPMKVKEYAPSSKEALELVLAMCDVAGLTPSQLKTELTKSTDVVMVAKPLFKPALQVAVDTFLTSEGAPKGAGARIVVSRDRVSIGNTARDALVKACIGLPKELKGYQPKKQPFETLRERLTTNPGIVAFLEYVSEPSSVATTTTTTHKHSFDSSGEDDKSTKLPNMGESEVTKVTGVELRRNVPPGIRTMLRNIDEAVRAIDIAHDGPQVNRVFTLGLKLDTVRSDIEYTLDEIRANMRKSKEFEPPAAVTEWLEGTLKALDPQVVEREIEARAAARKNAVG
ncbi:MAG: hypothetical protein K2Q01_04775 [Rickettsiales bacterium]|nr:hypothetical protein [Rickettsiales bacterium]